MNAVRAYAQSEGQAHLSRSPGLERLENSMDITKMLSELHTERATIDEAILTLEAPSPREWQTSWAATEVDV